MVQSVGFTNETRQGEGDQLKKTNDETCKIKAGLRSPILLDYTNKYMVYIIHRIQDYNVNQLTGNQTGNFLQSIRAAINNGHSNEIVNDGWNVSAPILPRFDGDD